MPIPLPPRRSTDPCTSFEKSAREELAEIGSQKITIIQKEETATPVRIKSSIKTKSVDFLDDFFGLSEAPTSTTDPSWDLNTLNPLLFVDEVPVQSHQVQGTLDTTGSSSWERHSVESRASLQDRLSLQYESDESSYCTPEDDSTFEKPNWVELKSDESRVRSNSIKRKIKEQESGERRISETGRNFKSGS